MFSFKSSAQRHPFVAATLSLGSLALVHGLTIAGHESVNHANPEQTLLYSLDTSLENVEFEWKKMRGEKKLSAYLNHQLEERVQELEHVLEEENYEQYVPMLLEKIRTITTANEEISTRIAQEKLNPSIQSSVVEFESSISEARKKLQLIAGTFTSEELVVNMDELLNFLAETDDKLEVLLADLNVELEQETIVETRIEYVPVTVPAQLIQEGTATESVSSEAIEATCSSQGQTCTMQSDCCTQSPTLFCRWTTGNEGRIKRCLGANQ